MNTPDMDTSYLTDLLEELGLQDHSEYLRGVARPSVELLPSDASPASCGSHFNGSPDLPRGFEWPQHDRGPYRFIGQINLAELPTGAHDLPTTGLLSCFYAHDEHGESFWQDPDYVRVYRFDSGNPLETREPPHAVRFGSSRSLRLQLGVDVPPWPWTAQGRSAWPLDESLEDAYWELRARIHSSGRYLLGYPFNTTLAYDPTPGPEWSSLLTLSSSDELDWSWHDGDWLVTFIERERLLASDFSKIQADAG